MSQFSNIRIMNRIIVFFFLFILSTAAFAQNRSQLDSIKVVLKNTHEVEKKITTYYELSDLYTEIDLDSSIMILEEALMLAKQIESDIEIAKSLFKIGHIEVKRDSLNKALLRYNQSIVYYKKLNQQKALCDILIIKGNIHYVKGDFPEAMQDYSDALRMARETDYDSKLPFCYNNLGIIYFKQEEYKQSLDYFILALSLFEEKKDSLNMALTLNNIGSIYLEFNSFQVAKQYYEKARKVYEKLEDKDGITQSMTQLAEIHLKNKQADSALIYLNNSLELYKNVDFDYRGPKSLWLVRIYLLIGETYMYKSDWEKAITNLMTGYRIAFRTSQIDALMNAAKLLSDSYDSLHNVDSSYKYFKVFKNYSDSILNEDNIRKIAQIDYQSKLDQKAIEKKLDDNKKIAQQKRKNLIYIIVFFFLILVIIFFMLLYQLEKNKKAKIDTERIQLKQDIEYKNKELTTHMLYLLKKNEFILSISEKLKKIIPSIKIQNKQAIAEIINELNAGSSDESWKEFEIRFQQVYTSFFDHLNKKHPDLSPNELRLCAFLKLNMTTKDISAITYQSTKSIEMARFRLRKKMKLDKDEQLISYLNHI